MKTAETLMRELVEMTARYYEATGARRWLVSELGKARVELAEAEKRASAQRRTMEDMQANFEAHLRGRVEP